MCGIAGYVHFNGAQRDESGFLTAALEALKRRGPDDCGTVVFGHAGLAHRRLSVLDTSQRGRQPMVSSDKQVAVVFNGEIYNHLELRKQLEAFCYPFHTHTDTEVILAGYLLWGAGVIERLQGMFALAVWDERKGELLLARDRLGKKPLFVHQTADGFYFASTVKALHTACARRSLNEQAVHDYFLLSYIPGEQTVFKEITRFAPATYRIVRRDGGASSHGYWSLREAIAEEPEVSLEQWEESLRAAVKTRSRADVPMGCFLSGGLDSAAVVRTLRLVEPAAPLQTFCVDFTEENFGEGALSKISAARYDTRHRLYTVPKPSLEMLAEVTDAFDEPFADTSMVPFYWLCKFARREITVAYSGDGGDECFAGYVTHTADAVYSWWRKLPRWLQRLGADAALDVIPQSRGKLSTAYKARQFFGAMGMPPEDAHFWWRVVCAPDEIDRLLTREFLRGTDRMAAWRRSRARFEEVAPNSFLKRAMYADIHTWLADDILTKADRASMAHGLEVRSPLLDEHLLAEAMRLPCGELHDGRQGKILFRRLLENSVPHEILHGRKQGFSAPFAHWFAGPLRVALLDALGYARRSLPFLQTAEIDSMMSDHLAGRRDCSYKLWTFLAFVLWHQRQFGITAHA